MIRKAINCDLESIAQINVSAWKINYKGIIDDDFIKTRTFEWVYKRWKESNWLEDNESITFVYEEDSFLKGYVSGKKNEKYDCEIVSIYVDPQYQNQGIGKKLLNHEQEYFKGIGCKNMIVWTIKGFQNNIFYEKYGGVILEKREIELGNKKYPGIGFVFKL
jgi:ribosomal protein S18 acetylase RimI-like enzyme